MFNNSELEQINVSIKEAEEAIQQLDALNRLINNKDFQTVIDTGYFRDEAARLVALKAASAAQTESTQKDIDNQIIAIGYLRRYFSVIFQAGSTAKRSLEDHRNTRNEIMAEQS